MTRLVNIAQMLVLLTGLAGMFILSAASSEYERTDVVATILPLHSIVSNIMIGVAKPGLLVSRTRDAHHVNLKPSQVSMIQQSKLVFWVGAGLETYLEKITTPLTGKIEILSMLDPERVELVKYRGGVVDPHIWLSSANARAIGKMVLAGLVRIDPVNETIFKSNFAKFEKDLRRLQVDIDTRLAGAKTRKYLISHNSLQYFARENGLHLQAVGSRNEELPPSAKQISKARRFVRSGDYSCLIVGPEANAAAIKSIAKDASRPLIVVDPLGSGFAPGPQLYFQLMRGIADQIANCR